MIKLALFGDSAIQHYTVSDRLWELLSVVINKKFKFNIIPFETSQEVVAGFDSFRKDRSFMGFNISSPWQGVLVEQMDELEELVDLPIINMVYKNKDGVIIGANTWPLAAQLAAEANGNLYKCKSVLVLGENKSGLTIAHHFCHNLDKKVYLYDPVGQYTSTEKEKDLAYLSSLCDVVGRKYDLIINATPQGRYYFDKRVEAFTSPLDLETLIQISHKGTIVQETNYLPDTTLLLQMAKHLQLQTVAGSMTLVFEAIESLKRYFGITLDANTMNMLVEEISAHIAEREIEILEQNNS